MDDFFEWKDKQDPMCVFVSRRGTRKYLSDIQFKHVKFTNVENRLIFAWLVLGLFGPVYIKNHIKNKLCYITL